MSISAQSVRELREKTNAGMMDCKKALTETDGDFDKAIEWLRKKGLSSAAKKAGRIASEGLVHCYLHAGGKIGVMVEINSETDFVARNDEFKGFVNDIALHVAAMNPIAVREEDMSAADIEKEKAFLASKAREEGKKEEMIERIVGGQINKYIAENCLDEAKVC